MAACDLKAFFRHIPHIPHIPTLTTPLSFSLFLFIPWFIVNASRRKCSAESSHDTKVKSMNEIELRNMRLAPPNR